MWEQSRATVPKWNGGTEKVRRIAAERRLQASGDMTLPTPGPSCS